MGFTSFNIKSNQGFKVSFLTVYFLLTSLGSNGNEVDTAKSSSRQLDYYVSKGTTFKNYSAAVKKQGTTQYFWWHRSARYNDDIQFYGMQGFGYAYRDGGISPAFKVG